MHDFVTGFLHPISGADHLAVMMALGFWSISQKSYGWHPPLIFATALLSGALLAQSGLVLPLIEPTIVASIFIMGWLVVSRSLVSGWAAGALIATLGIFHGGAHGQELAGWSALCGMLAGTFLLHLSGMILGRALLPHYQRASHITAGLLTGLGSLSAWTWFTT